MCFLFNIFILFGGFSKKYLKLAEVFFTETINDFYLLFYFRLIQEEKFNTEQRAEELEHRVGTGSVDNFDIFNNALGGGKSGRPHHSYWDTQPRNLTRSLPGSMVMPLDLDRVSPPHSGSSTPVSSRRSTPADILGSQYSYSQPQISNMSYLGGGSDTESGAISKVGVCNTR